MDMNTLGNVNRYMAGSLAIVAGVLVGLNLHLPVQAVFSPVGNAPAVVASQGAHSAVTWPTGTRPAGPRIPVARPAGIPSVEEAWRSQAVLTDPKSTPINVMEPSGGPYPVIQPGETLWIDVSLTKQRIYIMHDHDVLYTMITSGGINTRPDNSTPTGTFYVQERGVWFYSPEYHMGAEYWVSWLNHGEFLFHSVPMNIHHQVLLDNAKRLGYPDSHGCFHLTIPDAKWIYDNIPEGTKVVIHK
jgi:lipoprotein-anchoring transpeptidase ErfK/SrfK